jgi:hypothetical protein
MGRPPKGNGVASTPGNQPEPGWRIVEVIEGSDGGPARKIPKNYIHVTGMHPRASSGASAVGFESILEADFLMCLDFDPDVSSFTTQPVTVKCADRTRIRRYTPDALIHFAPQLNRKPWLCEVKTREDLKKNWDQLQPGFRAATRYARQKGYIFKIITDAEIRSQYQLNATFLLPFRRRTKDTIAADKIVSVLTQAGRAVLVESLMDHFETPDARQAGFGTLWHLVATGAVEANLHVPLTVAQLSIAEDGGDYLTNVIASCSARKGKCRRRRKLRQAAVKKAGRAWL